MMYVLNTSAPGMVASGATGQSQKTTPFPYQAPSKVSTGTIPAYPPSVPAEEKSEEPAAEHACA